MAYKSEYAFEYKHIFKSDKDCLDKAYKFCDSYKNFMNRSKTERECTKTVIEIARSKGYKEFNSSIKTLNPGEKYFVNNRDKSVVLFTVGKESLDKGVNFVVSHIDSPRLDLKPNPMYESDDIAYFKTH